MLLQIYNQVQRESLMTAPVPIIGFVSKRSSDLPPLKVNQVMGTGLSPKEMMMLSANKLPKLRRSFENYTVKKYTLEKTNIWPIEHPMVHLHSVRVQWKSESVNDLPTTYLWGQVLEMLSRFKSNRYLNYLSFLHLCLFP